MVIVMNPDARKKDVGAVLSLLRERGYDPRILSTAPRVVLGVVEETDRSTLDGVMEAVAAKDGVEGVEPFGDSYKLASRDFHPTGTVVHVNGREIGGPEIAVIAGPCAVESRQGINDLARSVAAAGATFLRGGAFKPRTSPYSFRGLGEEGLVYMAEASQATGLPIVTEVLSADDLPIVEKYAHVLQVGARNMQNFALLEALGDSDKPVLIKRGLMATIKELLLSAEYILAKGNSNVILCERGIRTFEPETRNTLDISAVPLLKSHSHLPVVVDPSHAAGKRELVPAMALAAAAAGADGIMVEVHDCPEKAVSDGRQSLTPDVFAHMMEAVGPVRRAAGAVIAV